MSYFFVCTIYGNTLFYSNTGFIFLIKKLLLFYMVTYIGQASWTSEYHVLTDWCLQGTKYPIALTSDFGCRISGNFKIYNDNALVLFSTVPFDKKGG